MLYSVEQIGILFGRSRLWSATAFACINCVKLQNVRIADNSAEIWTGTYRIRGRSIVYTWARCVNHLHCVVSWNSWSMSYLIPRHNCGMSQESRNLKFKGKYFVSVIEKFKFAQWQHWTLSPAASLRFDAVSSYSLFFTHLLCSQTSIMPFSTLQPMFTVEHYIRTQSCEAVEQAI
jgi:hypothetical protein